ncbi:hypothetical protein [Moraxella lacunata]|uniref:hypothetical protein n=1 Tax=Moraxella lacunata TaxID=477 RepID=UPI003EE36112
MSVWAVGVGACSVFCSAGLSLPQPMRARLSPKQVAHFFNSKEGIIIKFPTTSIN